MDEERIERIAARMRKVGERHELLRVNERLRIVVRQLERNRSNVL